MRISDWSSDVCSSDLRCHHPVRRCQEATVRKPRKQAATVHKNLSRPHRRGDPLAGLRGNLQTGNCRLRKKSQKACIRMRRGRSEEHTSELQSLMRTSYAVFCLKKKQPNVTHTTMT